MNLMMYLKFYNIREELRDNVLSAKISKFSVSDKVILDHCISKKFQQLLYIINSKSKNGLEYMIIDNNKLSQLDRLCLELVGLDFSIEDREKNTARISWY